MRRDFKPDAPGQVWASDITSIATDEGWLYLATTLDLCSRRIVGWSMSNSMETKLVLDALGMAVRARFPQRGLIHHSDRGSQYASNAFREELKSHGIRASMSRIGNCYDNAVAECFFHSLKSELVHREDFESRDEARAAVFDYAEVFYNRVRPHSTLVYLTPIEFELAISA